MVLRGDSALERTELARERTVLAWQRNRLSELTVLLGITGVGIVVSRFYPEYLFLGGSVVFLALLGMAYTAYHYLSLKGYCKEKNGINKKN